MGRSRIALLALLAVTAAAPVARAQGLRRFAIVAGNDTGGGDTRSLLYAGADARKVYDILTRLGGVRQEDATLLIGAKEWEAITAPKPAQGVNFKPFEHWIKGEGKVEPQAVDKDVFADGSVIVLRTPGHTPGHQALLVKLAQMGPVILSGDAVHFRENYESDGVPWFNFDRAQTVASIERIKKISANLKATLIIQHDARDIGKLPGYPGAAMFLLQKPPPPPHARKKRKRCPRAALFYATAATFLRRSCRCRFPAAGRISGWRGSDPAAPARHRHDCLATPQAPSAKAPRCGRPPRSSEVRLRP